MDVTSANVGMSRYQFLSNLVHSRLLSDVEVDQLTATHPDADAIGLASLLTRAGTLNDYQIEALHQGRQAELRIGNYDILDKLGAGGMGTVFKARHRRMKRIVALKVLAKNLCTDNLFIQRFQREVETIARLSHPNIVMAYDADEDECGHFLVMEFVNGRDLTSLVEKSHPVPVWQAVDSILQAARGLGYAHAQGIIHRDIKPANLLRETTGMIKVTDLGLARLSGACPEGSGLTQAGGVLGTVDYMSPEQAVDSTTIDHRADIYSLGATLYYLLSGQPPYTGKTIMAILLKHREGVVPRIDAVRTDVPPAIDEVYVRMMAKSVTERYQSMGEVVTALEAILLQLGGSPVVASTGAPSLSGVLASGSSVAVNGSTSTTAVAQPASLSVVVVEPSRVQSGIIRKYLDSQDIITAAVVATGKDAIEAALTNKPDAIVCAMHLADMTGIELAKQLRTQVKEHPPGFVLISSTDSDAANNTALSQMHRVILLYKPFTPEQLVQALNVVTGKSLVVKASGSSPGMSIVRPSGNSSLLLPTKRDRSTLRVLIVDDMPSARSNERAVLQSLGFLHFVEEPDGTQAIAAVSRESFDLIVTDYNMPNMDGLGLVRFLKQYPPAAAIPVMMVTSENDPAVLDPVRKLGVAAIFAKAFPRDAVKRVVDQLFGG